MHAGCDVIATVLYCEHFAQKVSYFTYYTACIYILARPSPSTYPQAIAYARHIYIIYVYNLVHHIPDHKLCMNFDDFTKFFFSLRLHLARSHSLSLTIFSFSFKNCSFFIMFMSLHSLCRQIQFLH